MNTHIETTGYGPSVFQDLDLGKKVLSILEKFYSGHAWFVNSMTESGYITIQLMYTGADSKLRVWKFGVLLHTNKLGTDLEMEKKIKNAGGEILERYRMARGKFTTQGYANFLKNGVDTTEMVK